MKKNWNQRYPLVDGQLTGIRRLAATGSVLVLAQSLHAGTHVDEIRVTGTRLPLTQYESAAPVGVVDREDIERRQARSLVDLLAGVPGVTSAGGPRHEAASPNVRGLGNGRVVVRLDGARQNLNIDHRGQTFLDPSLIERVEILRGPASTLYGSGAIGGVVNLHTLDAEGFLPSDRQLGGRVRAGYEDNAHQRSVSATFAGHRDGLGLLVSGSHRKAGDFEDGGGDKVPFSDTDVLSGLVKGSWRPSPDQRFTLSYLDYEDDSSSLITADRPAGTEIDRNTRQRSLTARYQWHPKDNPLWDLDVTLYGADVVLGENDRQGPNRRKNELETLGIDAFNTTRITAGGVDHHLTYGVEYYRDRQQGRQNGQPLPGFASAEQKTWGGFLQDRLELGQRLALTLGLRYDRIEQEAERPGLEDSRYSEWSTQGTLAYELVPGLSLYAGYAEAFRAPSLRELFVGGEHFPGNHYVPNPELKPESARNLEAGISFERAGLYRPDDRLHARGSIFRNDIGDFIEQVVLGAPDNITRFENVDDARVEGVELELRYGAPAYYLALTGAALRGDDRGENVPLESIPAHQVSLEGVLYGWDRSLETGLRVTAARAQNRVPSGPHTIDPTPSYTVLDLFASWRPTPEWRLDLGVDNLNDRRYRRHLSQINERGRTFKLAVSYQL